MKNNTLKTVLPATLFLLFLCIFSSCSKENSKRHSPIKKIFSFKIGYDKEELGLLPSKQGTGSTLNYYYNNGFYYLSDATNNKILKITETGVVILSIFNKENYPELLSNVASSEENTSDATETFEYLKLYNPYNLVRPGYISADIEKNIYVVNKDPDYKKLNNTNQIEDELIVKFNAKGEFQYLLDKNGIQKENKTEISPFSYLFKIGNDINNNLIAIEGYNNDLNLYKFSKEGKLLSKSILSLKNLPLSKNETNNIILLIDVIPGCLEDEVYVVYQFISKENVSAIDTFRIEYEKIFRFSLKENKFDKMLLKTSVEYEDLTKHKFEPAVVELYGDMKKIQKPLQTFIGVDGENNIYFYQSELPTNSLITKNFNLMKYNANGRLESKRYISYPYDIIYHSKMFLTSKGKIINYIAKEDEVTFVSIN